LIGALMGIQLLFGVLFGGSYDWLADAAGFAAGFCLSFFVGPGGWRKMQELLRRG
jgi:rhomboid protease GluP